MSNREWRLFDSPMRLGIEALCRVDKKYHLTTVYSQHPLGTGAHAGIAEPTLSFEYEEAQQLINELWRLGYRPKDGTGAIAHTEAMQAHLEDMRKIAFAELGIK